MADNVPKVPDSIKCDQPATDVCFHTEKAVVAVGDIVGKVRL